MPRPPADTGARRRAVVAAARRIAEDDGWSAVTVRVLAAELGLSQPMLYALFDGRDAVVSAVALQGFGELAQALDGSRDRRDLAERYLAFADEHPATYTAMFELPGTLRFASAETPPELVAGFEAIRAATDGDPVAAEVLWAALHGMARLEQAGRLPLAGRGDRLAALVGPSS